MPGQLFNISRYFKKGKSQKSTEKANQDEHVVERTTTTTTTTTSPIVGAQAYSGIGHPPGGGKPYSGIGHPPVNPQPTNQAVTQQTTVEKKKGKKKEGAKPVGKGKPAAGYVDAVSSKRSMTMQKRVSMDILTRLTQRSTQALMQGVNKAKELHVRYVDTEHILWGLLADSGVYKVVSELKTTPKEIQQALEKQMKPGNFAGSPKFSPRVKRVLELALSAAKSLGYEFISPEHILLALAQEGEGMAAQILAKHGLTVEELNRKITGKKKGVDEKREERGKGSILDQYTDDLTQKAREGKLDPVVARSAEIERVIHILSRRTKNNPVLIGDAGVGKTAIVEGLAQRIARGDVPETLLNKRIVQLDLMSLIAGARHRGEFEERLKNLIKEVRASTGQIILFIDEIHNMVGAGSGSEGTMDASNILKPSLARGELQTIGTTTITEYRRYIEKDPALERRFQPILVVEPKVDQAIEMLRALRDKYEAFHKVSIPDETIEAAVRLSQRYVGDRFLPDKAVDLIDEAAAAVRLPAISLPEEIKSIQERLKRLNTEKNDAEKLGDTVRLASLTRELEELDKTLEEKKRAYELKKSTTTNVVSPEIIQEIVSRWTNIPISKLTESESEKLLNLEGIIHKRIIDQENAVSAVAEAVRRGRAGLKSTKRPIGSFIFMGPTGVGKTELAKVIAEVLFGSEEMMVRLDMTEYMEKHEVAKLIGAPPGYVGYEEGGQLTEAVRRRPYSVVLLDEIEKAHPDVFNILIQILDDGRLTDNKGHVISFKNTIVICTSNIGTGLIQKEMLIGEEKKITASALDTYTISPTGRKMITLGNRIWERAVQVQGTKVQPEDGAKSSTDAKTSAGKQKSRNGWMTKLLKDYFAGNTVVNADLHDAAKMLPEKGVDTHVISPSGEELITSGGRYWMRRSTTAKEWTTDSLINYFKNHMVVNAYPDQPEQQLPTVKLGTNAISPSEMQVITLGDRFWKRGNFSTQDWVTGKLADYVKDCVVVAESQNHEGVVSNKGVQQSGDGVKKGIEGELDLAERIIRDPQLQLPTKKWDVHLFTPRGEEVIIVGDRFWKRGKQEDREWTTLKLEKLFESTTVVNADPEKEEELLPVGQEVIKDREDKEKKEDQKFSELADKLLDELRKTFRPELLNRYDEIIVFRPLTQEHMLAIVDLQLKNTAKLLEEQNIGFSSTPRAKRELAVLGFDPIYGARPLRRTIQREIENPISSLLIEGKVKSGDTINVDYDGNDFLFSVEHFSKKVKDTQGAAEALGDATAISYRCNNCNSQFDTKVVSNSTVICPQCASGEVTVDQKFVKGEATLMHPSSSQKPPASPVALGTEDNQHKKQTQTDNKEKGYFTQVPEPESVEGKQTVPSPEASMPPEASSQSASAASQPPDLSAYFGQENNQSGKQEGKQSGDPQVAANK